MLIGYSAASRGATSWGAGRDISRLWTENFWKYVESSLSMLAGARWRSGKAGITGSFCRIPSKIIPAYMFHMEMYTKTKDI